MDGLLSGYSSTIADAASRKRYAESEKLELVDGIDPYEVAKGDWQDDVDWWPAITQLQVCVPHPSSESLLRKGFHQLQKPGLLPEFCSRLGEASAHETRS